MIADFSFPSIMIAEKKVNRLTTILRSEEKYTWRRLLRSRERAALGRQH